MDVSISKENFEKLLEQPRLLRSLINQNKIFCRLNDKKILEVVGTQEIQNLDFSTEFEEANKNFEHIIDDKERAEAYRDLAQQLSEIVKKEKSDNLKNLEENSEFIREQQKQIENLENELKLSHEQSINSKDIINQLSEEISDYKKSIELLEEESTKLNKRITDAYTSLDIIDIQSIIRNAFLSRPIDNLNDSIQEIVSNYNASLEQAKNLTQIQRQVIMQVEAKDVIAGIPMFSGEPKLLDGFINASELYYNLVEEAQKPTVLKIIKAKITGDALFKAGPFEDDLNAWALLKARLKERIKKPVSLEYA